MDQVAVENHPLIKDFNTHTTLQLRNEAISRTPLAPQAQAWLDQRQHDDTLVSPKVAHLEHKFEQAIDQLGPYRELLYAFGVTHVQSQGATHLPLDAHVEVPESDTEEGYYLNAGYYDPRQGISVIANHPQVSVGGTSGHEAGHAIDQAFGNEIYIRRGLIEDSRSFSEKAHLIPEDDQFLQRMAQADRNSGGRHVSMIMQSQLGPRAGKQFAGHLQAQYARDPEEFEVYRQIFPHTVEAMEEHNALHPESGPLYDSYSERPEFREVYERDLRRLADPDSADGTSLTPEGHLTVNGEVIGSLASLLPEEYGGHWPDQTGARKEVFASLFTEILHGREGNNSLGNYFTETRDHMRTFMNSVEQSIEANPQAKTEPVYQDPLTPHEGAQPILP